jgi:DNA invertase Pin-like site-specific DNA recombinase
MNQTKLKAYSYIRWSSDLQTKGDSLRRQEELAEDICRIKGWILDPLKRDEGVSAYTGQNIHSGALGDFLIAVQEKRIKTPCILIIEAFDRLTRLPPLEALTLVQSIIKEGVTICTATNGQEYNKSSYETLEPLLVSLCQFNVSFQHSEGLSRRLRASWVGRKEKAVSEKLVLTRKLPAWIKLPKKAKTTDQFEINEEKATIIRRIYKEYLSGVGTNTIARNLTRDKIKAFETKKEWNVSTITKWLTSKTVIGHLQPHMHFSKKRRVESGEIIENYYPAIISEKDFFAAQELRKRRLIPRGPKKNKHNLFTGIIRCKKCGSSMAMRVGGITAKRTNPYRTLICGSAWRGGKCKFATMPYLHFEDIILNTVFSNIAGSMSSSNNRPEDMLLEIDGKIEEKSKKIKNITNLIESGDATSRTLVKRLMELEHDLDELDTARHKLPKGISNDWIRELHENWKPLENNTENRERVASILRRLIHSISIDSIVQEADIRLNYNNEIINNIKWDRKDKTWYELNGVKLPKAPSLVWINEGRIIPLNRLIKMKKGFKQPIESDIYDNYIVYINVNSELIPHNAVVTKKGTFYNRVIDDAISFDSVVYKDAEPAVLVT